MGLLDFMSSDDAKLGLGLLAAGGQSAVPLDTWQRVQGAVQGLDADKQRKLQLELMQSQADENKQQALLRAQQLQLAQRKQAWDEQFMGGGLLGPAPGSPSAAAPAQAAPGVMSAPTQPAAAPAGGGFNAQAISQKYGVPLEAVVSDFRFNGGKKIAELIAKRAEPNWVNVNGNLVNTNAEGFQGGVQGGVSAGNDGRVTQWQPDGKGGLVVGAPRGALDTYAAYQGIGARTSADYTPQEVIDPTTGQRKVVPRSQVLQPSAGGVGNVQSPGYAGGDRTAANIESIRIMEAELRKPGNNAADIAGIQREIGRLKMQSGLTNAQIAAAPMAGNVVEFSPQEKATQEATAAAAKAGAVKRAEGAAENAIAAPQKALQAGDAITLIDKALAHPGLKNAVGMAGVVDPRNYMPGTDAKNFQQIKAQLDGTAFMTAYQGLRGTGSISEKEGAKAEAAVARMSTAQSESAFREALGEYRAILVRGQENAAAASRGEAPAVKAEKAARTVVKSGMYQGRKVIQYSDGSVDYAN